MTFDAKSTALEVIEGHDLKGYEAIVTGGASGIGVETVRALAKAGARVIIATRNLEQAEQVAEQLRTETGNSQIEAEKLDLSSLKSVGEFAEKFAAKKRPLNLLINNAGVMACPLGYTEDGFETQIGTNHFGHFALFTKLVPFLKEGKKKLGKNSRVVAVSSLAHYFSDVDINDINFKKRDYEGWQSYGQSKTANILFAVGANKRYAGEGIISNALHPGGIMTNLQRHMPEEQKRAWGMLPDAEGKINPRFKSVEQGASTTIWAAVAPEFENKGGLYFENCSIGKLSSVEDIKANWSGIAAYALDEKNADKLWELSEKLIKNPPKSS